MDDIFQKVQRLRKRWPAFGEITAFYYIRFRCYKRSATSIETIVNAFINKSGRIHEIDIATKDEEEEDNINSKTFSEEEVLLSSLYFSDEANTSKIESCIWEIQELPYFLDGKGVGGNTILEFPG